MNMKRDIERRATQGSFSVLEDVHQNFANPDNTLLGRHSVTP
jgi:hypothetical protein